MGNSDFGFRNHQGKIRRREQDGAIGCREAGSEKVLTMAIGRAAPTSRTTMLSLDPFLGPGLLGRGLQPASVAGWKVAEISLHRGVLKLKRRERRASFPTNLGCTGPMARRISL